MAKRRYTKKHRGTKYAVKCGARVVSRHRKKRAAQRAKPARKGCRVIKKKG
jgi:hypothetical protein